MKKISVIYTFLGATLALFLNAAPADAQATRTWVSGVGDDANPCSRTAPCKTFAGAISKTAINGEINCLDPGGFGTVTITKSITIDCHEIFASILASGTNGININLTTPLTADPLQTVRLRNININGSGSCGGGCGGRSGLRGINILSAKNVFVEDVLITQFLNEGIRDSRTTGKLYVKNTIVRDNTGTGILVVGTSLDAVVDDSQIHLNNFGVAVTSGNHVMVNRSVFSGNATGAEADNGGQIVIDNSTISSNQIGILANAGSTVQLSNNTIAFNGTGINGGTLSFTNNRIAGNTAAGNVPTQIGGATIPTGQQ